MHRAVMLQETMGWLAIRPGGIYVDGTVGSGGHAEEILRRSAPDGRLLGLDRDPEALERTGRRLARYGDRLTLVCENHARMAEAAQRFGLEAIDGVLLDLGVSSDQLDTPARGFSFRSDGPLDMRMGPDAALSAGELLETFDDWRPLAELLRRYGEEHRAARIARAIWEAQQRSPIRSTGELAYVVARACGGTAAHARHPATRTFQALRIAVNNELESLEQALEAGISLLSVGGRMAVIAFQSLEDRRVKQCFREHAGRRESLHQGGEQWTGRSPAVRVLTQRPIVPSAAEQAENPRSRSAKLRVAERQENVQTGRRDARCRNRSIQEDSNHGTT